MRNNLIRKSFAFIYKSTILSIVRSVNTRISSEIPKYEVGKKNIKNAKLLTNREELLELMPKNGVVAELGVDEGNFSELILKVNQPKKLHMVDYWGSKQYNQEKRKKVESRFNRYIQDGTVCINLGLSTEVVDSFEDNYFDWIYIDTSHTYETTIKELETYSKKVKPNGIIAGHDFIIGNWNDTIRYGVVEAVCEFCVKYNWEILYLTTDFVNYPSFALRKVVDNEEVNH